MTMARGPVAARQFITKTALGAVAFIVAHPRLDDFLRRQVFRFPGLAGRVRALVGQSRRAGWQPPPVVLRDEAELTDGAREVLRELRRAIDHTRTP